MDRVGAHMITSELALKLCIAVLISTVTIYLSIRSKQEHGLEWGIVFAFLLIHVSHMFW